MHHISTSDDTKLYYKDWQPNPLETESNVPKRTVVLMSGWPLTADSWEDQAHAIASAGHRVIAYDRRGFGRSSQPFSGYDYDTLADDLHAVLARTQAHNVVLVGFSMGGGEVVRYLAKYPENNVIKAVLVSSVVSFKVLVSDDPSGNANAAYEQTKHALLKDRPAFFTGFFDKFFGVDNGVEAVSPELLLWARSTALQGCLPATLGCFHAFSHTNFDVDLRAVKVPLLVIHGSADKIVPVSEAGRKKLSALPLAQLLEYPGAPHGLFATHKTRLTQDLLKFVES